MPIPEGMITVQEAARRLNRSIEQVRRYLREGKLKGQRIGQQWFIPSKALEMGYRPGGGRLQRVKEPSAVMDVTKEEANEKGKRLISEELIAEMERLREEIRREHGTFDVIAMIRRTRRGH